MRYELKDIGHSYQRIIGAIVIFLLTSYSFYAFFNLSRETIRYLSTNDDYDIWILSSSEIAFYNTIYASISIIIAAGFAFAFIIDRSSYPYRSIAKRTSLLNDFRVLSWVFVAWIYELGLAYGIYFVASISYYDFSFYPRYNYFFVLLVIVLYLQLWVSIRRQFVFRLFKHFAPITLFFVFCSFVLGSISFIDHQKIDDSVLSKSVYDNYKISKPQASSWKTISNKSMSREIFLCFSLQDSINSAPVIIYDNVIIRHSSLDSLVDEWFKYIPKSQRVLFQTKLTIDGSVPMKEVNRLRSQLFRSDVRRAAYSVVPKGSLYNQRRYKHSVIETYLADYNTLDIMHPKLIEEWNINELSYVNDHIEINGETVSYSELMMKIEHLVRNKSKIAFDINQNNNLLFKDFILLFDAIRNVTEIVRNEYSLKEFGELFDWLTYQDRRDVAERYPVLIIDSYDQ